MRKQWALLVVAGLLLWGYTNRCAVTADNYVEIQEESKYVALTFDDGPNPETTETLLNGLRERGASATFFLVGEQAQQYPELVRQMKADGHQIGNHTWSHVRLDEKEPAVVQEEIDRTERFLQEILGGSHYWLRPPYGQIAPEMEKRISVPIIKWSVDPRDWESRDQQKIKQAILADVKPNSIVLLHDIYMPSVDAALQVIDVLQAEGYWFVTVEELLRLNGITAEPGVFYRSGET